MISGYSIFLDDERRPDQITWVKLPNTNWEIAKNFDEFIELIKKFGIPKVVSFDHDLGKDKNGYDCAKYLFQYCLDKKIDLPEYHVHSLNPVGTVNIYSLLDQYKNAVGRLLRE
jgi:Cyclic-phosphate processing Receiver domain